MAGFVEYLLRTEHVLIAVAVWVAISTAQRIVPSLAQNARWVRLLPVLPILGCSALVWLPGLVDGSPAQKVLLGIVLGSACGHLHKLVRQTILGNDKRIRDHPARL